jgi:predicted phosphate transport protein (TIGR00153 family)
MPKEAGFYDLFNRHAATITAGASALRSLLDGGPDLARHCQTINDQEDKADAITREGLAAVRRTFITPFDRGDIKDLITTLDDAIDQMKKTGKVVTLFEVKSFDPSMRELGDVIVEAAGLVAEAVSLLPQMSRNAARLTTLAEQVAQLEDRADMLYDAGRVQLFKAGGEAMDFIIGVELYSHLEKVADKLEDVANRISGILIENL